MSAKAGAGIFKKLGGIRRSYTLVATVALIFIVVGSLIYVAMRDNDDTSSPKSSVNLPKGVAGPEQVEGTYKSSLNESLAKKDYNAYQISQRAIAIQYYANKDFSNAERVLKEVLKVVPESELDSVNLTLLAAVYKSQGDESSYKEYKAKAVAALKANGQTDEANDLEKEEFTNR